MRIALNAVTVWTGHDGVVEDARIEIENHRIVGIEHSGSSKADRVIDGAGSWVIPGLIDSHLHIWGIRSSNPVNWVVDPMGVRPFRAMADLRKILNAGFTTVREAGGQMGPSIKKAIDEGSLIGPRVYPAHLGLSSTGGHGDCHSLPLEWVEDRPYMATIADGGDAVRRAVRRVSREGGRWVKVWASGAIALSDNDAPDQLHYSVEELRILCEEAHALGMPVGAHAEFPSAINACIDAGVDVIEHGFILDEQTCDNLVKNDVPIVTTMALLRRYLRWDGPEITPEQVAMARELLPQIQASARLAHSKGVTLAMGSDSFAEPLTPFGANAEELLALSEAGIPNEDCLRAATINGAKVLRMENEIGSIKPGHFADLVMLGTASPLDDLTQVTDTNNISMVIKGGEPIAGTRVSATW
ncbi:MAG TPA: amidohydrolase family protein [Terrimesophilobacter sp.]|nr:amidohydrolase family protein [Terrimesophilobacter sp.]HRP99197.1 amidohydrolase family protein [Terrimesophilobacter sp.]